MRSPPCPPNPSKYCTIPSSGHSPPLPPRPVFTKSPAPPPSMHSARPDQHHHHQHCRCSRLRSVFNPLSRLPNWHRCFLLLLFLLILPILFYQILEMLDAPQQEGSANNGTAGEGPKSAAENSVAEWPLSDWVEPNFSGQLFPMRDYLDGERLHWLLALAGRYARNGTRTVGMELSEQLLPGQVDLDRMDRESIARLELRAIVDEMAQGDEKAESAIREWMREEARLDTEAQAGRGRQWQTNAWDVCLGQTNTLCNRHLSAHWHCICQLVPQQQSSPPAPPLCSARFQLPSVRRHVLSVALGFPLFPLVGSYLLQDLFLAHWMAHLLRHRIQWVILLRKGCLSETTILLQFAFLRQPAVAANEFAGQRIGKMRELLNFLSLEEIGVAVGRTGFGKGGAGGRLWLDQTMMEQAAIVEMGRLLMPERMDRQQTFFSAKIAQIPVPACQPPWDYSSFLRCHCRQPLFLTAFSLFGLGIPLGIFRFWQQMLNIREKRGRRGMSR